MNTLARQLQKAIVVLANLDPRLRLTVAVVVLLFSLALSIFANALYDLLRPYPWVVLGLPFLLLLGSLTILAMRERLQPASAPRITQKPKTYPGLIVMLSIYRSHEFADQPDQPSCVWTLADLQNALAQPTVDWASVCQRITHSNLQPAMAAISYHSHDQRLRHLWLLSTKDLTAGINDDGSDKVKQTGSHHLAPLLARTLKEGFGYDLRIYHDDSQLRVSPYDISEIYKAVEAIYEVDATVVGLSPDQVIADLTGGRATLTAGMVLACAPRGWAMQYTSTDHDPATGGVADTLIPLRIDVNVSDILRRALETRRSELG